MVESIEYSWSLANGRYPSKILKLKKGGEQFKTLVDEVTSREFLNMQKIQKFIVPGLSLYSILIFPGEYW